MKTRSYASRKFLLCGISLVFGLAGYVYALVYNTDQFATICTFIVSVLGVYGGSNLADTYLGNAAQPKLGTPESKDTSNDKPGD
jgi:hypothetical protein